jgi:hypothetical protein
MRARTSASFEDTSAAAELSAVPNGKVAMANGFTSVGRCQPPLFGRAERHLLQSPRRDDAG